MSRSTALILGAFILSGCASLNQQQCELSDWQKLGEQDGKRGYPATRLETYQSDCAEFFIEPDANAYLAGRQQGLADFCTESSGFEAGWADLPYQNVCQGEAEAAFLRGYLRGRDAALFYCWTGAFSSFSLRHRFFYSYPFRSRLFCD
ncbi:DUF2799 domain-containing protein [Neptuniibacter sp. CAU 1671]|uniref:DUF2799 domain-containing protein n=1 Tax=Neptuniibacter sp. CAU 1671 TaxID=3032593 RepID=UPI0023D98BD9|nr:DUF2799 domain-containing protein [Neptuniibacter sp. CAU 1671]MDF2181450.1 DUF2799 domain-containing protein [Neptuniibacter sp. CAU 1671]